MTKFRVLKTSYIQDGIHEPGEIVDIDPSSVNPGDDNLELVVEKKEHKAPPVAAAPAAPVSAPPAPAPAPVAVKPPVPTPAPPAPKPVAIEPSTPKPVIVSPDGKENPIVKPVTDKHGG